MSPKMVNARDIAGERRRKRRRRKLLSFYVVKVTVKEAPLASVSPTCFD